jgi:hypothetical protein
MDVLACATQGWKRDTPAYKENLKLLRCTLLTFVELSELGCELPARWAPGRREVDACNFPATCCFVIRLHTVSIGDRPLNER